MSSDKCLVTGSYHRPIARLRKVQNWPSCIMKSCPKRWHNLLNWQAWEIQRKGWGRGGRWGDRLFSCSPYPVWGLGVITCRISLHDVYSPTCELEQGYFWNQEGLPIWGRGTHLKEICVPPQRQNSHGVSFHYIPGDLPSIWEQGYLLSVPDYLVRDTRNNLRRNRYAGEHRRRQWGWHSTAVSWGPLPHSMYLYFGRNKFSFIFLVKFEAGGSQPVSISKSWKIR